MANFIIEFNRDLLNTISQHLEDNFPNEGCGFFLGKEGTPRVVTEILPVVNSKEGDQRRRFEIAAIDYIKAEQYALTNGLNLLGIYHSHPNHPAIPSEHDRKQALPYFSYLILSIQNGKFAKATSWRLQETTQQFEEEIIHINKLKLT